MGIQFLHNSVGLYSPQTLSDSVTSQKPPALLVMAEKTWQKKEHSLSPAWLFSSFKSHKAGSTGKQTQTKHTQKKRTHFPLRTIIKHQMSRRERL